MYNFFFFFHLNEFSLFRYLMRLILSLLSKYVRLVYFLVPAIDLLFFCGGVFDFCGQAAAVHLVVFQVNCRPIGQVVIGQYLFLFFVASFLISVIYLLLSTWPFIKPIIGQLTIRQYIIVLLKPICCCASPSTTLGSSRYNTNK